ncbi:MAG: hypothetical protein Q9222_006606 [Ikaeria aurantiellina]
MTSSASSSGKTALPSPISWPPSQYWEPEGGWSSFNLHVGSLAQVVRVLISTAGQATWVVSSLGCPSETGPSCNDTRGDVFVTNASRTWHPEGFRPLDLELNLYPSDNATYGLDTVGLGFTAEDGCPSLPNQVVAAMSGYEFVLGMFGLGQQPTNFTDFTDENQHPSFLTSLYTQNLIPSLSWAYTAGARYRLKGVFGSVTLGGYDEARFVPNDVTFNMATDISRDLVVGLQRIVSTERGSSTQLLPSPHYTFIDSTIPYIYLPIDACRAFEQLFGLVWNATFELYLVDDELHDILTTRNPNITFQIGNSDKAGPTVNITLPYAAFDLTYKPWFDSSPIRYFPLKRAANDTQLTLGRAFLQEAYLITNFENTSFSVSQARFQEPIDKKIMPILPANALSTEQPTAGLGRGEIAGITVGSVLGFFLLLTICCWPCLRRQGRMRRVPVSKGATISSVQEVQDAFDAVHRLRAERSSSSLLPLKGFSEKDIQIQEVDTNTWRKTTELADNGVTELPEQLESARIYELHQSTQSHSPRDTSRLPDPMRVPRVPHSPRSRYGMYLPTDQLLSRGNIVKHWFEIAGLRDRQSDVPSNNSVRTLSTLPRLIESYLEKSLPPSPSTPTTVISESPQIVSDSAWTRIAARRHEQPDHIPTSNTGNDDSFQHRMGFF